VTSLLGHVRRGFVWPYSPQDTYSYGGTTYFAGTAGSSAPNREDPLYGFMQLVNGPFRSNPIVFACELKRLSIFKQARFVYRGFNKGRPGRLFSTPELDILESPWPRGTTGDLLANMLLYADIGGNAFVTRSVDGPDRLRVLRPDWVTIVMGDSSGRPVESPSQLDAEIIGFIYDPKDGKTEAEVLVADEVAHWAPIPDPLARFRGMSWLTPIIREVQADSAATMHKLSFFENGATPQMVVTVDAGVTEEQFKKLVATMDDRNAGWRNAYKTLYLGAGATPTVVGKDLQQLDFSATQGKGETRIAAASGIHPVLIPLSEGLSGSSLNAGNYQAARRSTADTTLHPLWQGVCGALEQIVPPPNRGAELWYDEQYIPFLREDTKDLADIRVKDATTMESLIRAGFKPDTVRDSLLANDFSLLEHTNLYSVQLIPPTTKPLRLPAGGSDPSPEAGVNAPGPMPAAMGNGNGGPP
jgi:phage portal protein BeeE